MQNVSACTLVCAWRIHTCLHVHLSVHVWVCGCSARMSKAWAGQSLICHPLRSTDMQPKQTDVKTERKASLCSSAVQFVLTLSGVLSSPLILMSSPGFRLTGGQRPNEVLGLGKRRGSRVTSIHPRKQLHINTGFTTAHRQKLVERCQKVLYLLQTESNWFSFFSQHINPDTQLVFLNIRYIARLQHKSLLWGGCMLGKHGWDNRTNGS